MRPNSPNDQEDSGSNMQSMKQIEEIRRELQDARKALHNAVSGANYALMRLSKLNYKLDDSEADRESSEGESREQEMAYGYLMEQVERVQAQNEQLLDRAERAEAAARDLALPLAELVGLKRSERDHDASWNLGREALGRHPGCLED